MAPASRSACWFKSSFEAAARVLAAVPSARLQRFDGARSIHSGDIHHRPYRSHGLSHRRWRRKPAAGCGCVVRSGLSPRTHGYRYCLRDGSSGGRGDAFAFVSAGGRRSTRNYQLATLTAASGSWRLRSSVRGARNCSGTQAMTNGVVGMPPTSGLSRVAREPQRKLRRTECPLTI